MAHLTASATSPMMEPMTRMEMKMPAQSRVFGVAATNSCQQYLSHNTINQAVLVSNYYIMLFILY